MSINCVAISGNLGHRPNLKALPNGTEVCEFSVCVNDRKKEGDKWVDVANWVDVTFFGKRAETLSKRLSKGSLVMVKGKLRQSVWEDKNGNKRSKLTVIGEDIAFDAKQCVEETQADAYEDSDVPF